MEQESSHFQVIDGDGSLVEQGSDVRGPREAPHSGVNALFATEPHTPGAPLAGITEAHKVGPTWHKLGAFGWSVCHEL